MQRRHFLGAGLALPALPALFNTARAAPAYPASPITLIVAYVAGGSTDQRARQFGAFMARALDQPVIVQNRPGAAGNIGTEAVARAKPDGYTLGMGNLAPLSVNRSLMPAGGFDPVSSLTMIALIERGPLMLVVNADSPHRDVPSLLAAARAKPGGFSYGSSGVGSAHHLSGELLKSLTGAPVTHVPYKGGAAAVTDLIGGHLDFLFEPMYSAIPYTRSGKLRALAITSEHRSPIASDVPTMAQAGVPGFHMENWQGLIGPAGMPPAVVQQLNEVVNRALQDPAIREQMLAQGNELGGGTPQEFTDLVRAESIRWQALIARTGIAVN
ncbi:MAG: Bug family tripartite tricarboxylate transporter substrate binding protein [Achromobacter marplatensis]|uniref:Bug family tripartite tricarboxylate transporter substrate binding protein n=1 Tax=Achromobacter marplatensis TaxID=470868 RepID=UPI003D003DAB